MIITNSQITAATPKPPNVRFDGSWLQKQLAAQPLTPKRLAARFDNLFQPVSGTRMITTELKGGNVHMRFQDSPESFDELTDALRLHYACDENCEMVERSARSAMLMLAARRHPTPDFCIRWFERPTPVDERSRCLVFQTDQIDAFLWAKREVFERWGCRMKESPWSAVVAPWEQCDHQTVFFE